MDSRFWRSCFLHTQLQNDTSWFKWILCISFTYEEKKKKKKQQNCLVIKKNTQVTMLRGEAENDSLKSTDGMDLWRGMQKIAV